MCKLFCTINERKNFLFVTETCEQFEKNTKEIKDESKLRKRPSELFLGTFRTPISNKLDNQKKLIRKYSEHFQSIDRKIYPEFDDLLPTLEYCHSLLYYPSDPTSEIKNSIFFCGPSAVGKSTLIKKLGTCEILSECGKEYSLNDVISWEGDFEHGMKFFNNNVNVAGYFVSYLREKLDDYHPKIYEHSVFCSTGYRIVHKFLKIYIKWMNDFRHKFNADVLQKLPDIFINVFFHDTRDEPTEFDDVERNIRSENFCTYIETILYRLKNHLHELQNNNLTLTKLLLKIDECFEIFFNSLSRVYYWHPNSYEPLNNILNDTILDISQRIFQYWCYKFSYNAFKFQLNDFQLNINRLLRNFDYEKTMNRIKPTKKNIIYILLDTTPNYVKRYTDRLKSNFNNIDSKNLFYLNLQFVMYCALLNFRSEIKKSLLKDSLIIRLILTFDNLDSDVTGDESELFFSLYNEKIENFNSLKKGVDYRASLFARLCSIFLSHEQRNKMWNYKTKVTADDIYNFHTTPVEYNKNEYSKSIYDYIKMIVQSQNHIDIPDSMTDLDPDSAIGSVLCKDLRKSYATSSLNHDDIMICKNEKSSYDLFNLLRCDILDSVFDKHMFSLK